jgi:hypothetical protein
MSDASATPGDAEAEDERVRFDVQRYGWHVALIPPEDAGPGAATVGWAFTIGLHETHRHPEILVFGRDVELLHALLNRCGDAVRRGWRFDETRTYAGLVEGYACAFRKVDPRWYAAFLGNAQWHYRGDDFPALQLFWPDAERRFPWQDGFATEWRADQPLLFLDDAAQALPAALAESLRREGAL